MPDTQPGALMQELRRLHANGDQAASDALLRQIFDAHPDFMPAHRWLMDQALEAGDFEHALTLARNTLFHFPHMRAMATTKQAIALDRLGQSGAAMRVLFELHDDQLQDLPATILLATLLFRNGSLDRAEHLFNAVLAENQAHPAAMRGLMDIALQRGQPNVALDLCDKAMEAKCLPVSLLQTRRAQCLDALGQGPAAIAAVKSLMDGGVADAQTQIMLGRLHQKAGDLTAARDVFDALLAETPDHPEAVQGQMLILGQLGAFDAAIDVCNRAVEHAEPVPDAFHVYRAKALCAAGRPQDAAASLEKTHNGSFTLRMALADAYVQTGDLDKADAIFAACQDGGRTQTQAVLGRVRIAARRKDNAGPVRLLHDALAATDTPEPTLILALCDALIRVGDTGKVDALLQELTRTKVELRDDQIGQVLDLAERQTLPHIASAIIDKAAGRRTLSLVLARRLLRLAHVTADGQVLERVADALTQKLPIAQQSEFHIDAVGLADGPMAALAQVRKTFARSSTPQRATLIGRYLTDMGHALLAMRYLRRAVRTWPGHKALNTLFIHACSAAQDHAAGHAHLDAIQARVPELDIERERLVLLHSEGATQGVLDRAAIRRDSGLPGLHSRQFLDLCLACGDLERAISTQHEIRNDPSSTSRIAAHFTTGLHGRMLTDLQVYRALEAKQLKGGATKKEIQSKLADQYYFAAKSILDQFNNDLAFDGARRTFAIPKRIFQYWDTDTVPGDVAALISDWQDVPGFEHVLMNRARATTMLRRQFDRRVLTAFQRARHVTEECDLLRLCLIYKFGGIYSDADDGVAGNIGMLAELGAGLVVTREPIGAIANNTLIAPPGNPVLRIALNMTVSALLARDADGAWFKSGPGMLTRAAAVFLRDTDPGAARKALTLLDGKTLRKYVQPHIRLPYKKTVKYWNAQDKEVSQKVLNSLIGMTSHDKK